MDRTKKCYLALGVIVALGAGLLGVGLSAQPFDSNASDNSSTSASAGGTTLILETAAFSAAETSLIIAVESDATQDAIIVRPHLPTVVGAGFQEGEARLGAVDAHEFELLLPAVEASAEAGSVAVTIAKIEVRQQDQVVILEGPWRVEIHPPAET